MNLGNMIKKHRQSKNLTQEEFSEYLNISASAVSQWETNKSVPDVSTLLAIADFFDISLDELFERKPNTSEQDIAEYEKQAMKFAKNGEIQKELWLWKEAVQKHPGNFRCLSNLAHSLFTTLYSNPDGEEFLKNVKECISICERILRDCKDTNIRASVTQLLVYIYSDKRIPFADENKAVEYAMMAESLYVCREILLERAYYINKEKQLLRKHSNNLTYMDLLCMNICYSDFENEEEGIKACNAVLDLWKTLIYDGNYQFYHCRLQFIYQELAVYHSNLRNKKETIESLQHAIYHAKCYDSLPEGEQHYTSIFVKAAISNVSAHTKNYEESNTDIVFQIMERNSFDFVRNDTEFIALYKYSKADNL